MKQIPLLLVAVLFLTSSPRSASAAPADELVAQKLCQTLFGNGDFEYDQLFSPLFRQAIPLEYLQQLVRELRGVTSLCKRVEKMGEVEGCSHYRLIDGDQNSILIRFCLGSEGLIEGFRIVDVDIASIVVASREDTIAFLQKMEGSPSLSLTPFTEDGERDAISYRSKERQPIASAFKLYVLGALVDAIAAGDFRWDQQFPLRQEWKSLPSGVMQDWESGRQISLREYADYMIRISDNTATDHLIHILGRERVEQELIPMGNDFPLFNTPFLTTAEAFKLKWAAPIELIDSYRRASSEDRRRILEKDLPSIPMSAMGSNGVAADLPSFISEVEWFASTEGVCAAMRSLKERGSKEVLEILAQNSPPINVGGDSPWSYAGFKGGSEPGVLTATYLLQKKSGEWSCLSFAWSNERGNLNQWIFFGLLNKLLSFAQGS